MNNKKLKTVLEKNTFYFFDKTFEESYEGHINSLKELLLQLKNDIESDKLNSRLIENFLIENKKLGINALLTLTGFANESFKRIITLVRISNDAQLRKLIYYDKWKEEENESNLIEWSDSKINRLISSNKYFRKGIVNLFFKGSTIPFLVNTLPLFEIKKFGISKLKFEIPEMIDTLIRYKEKGSYSGNRKNNPEIIIEKFLNELEIPFNSGDLTELINFEQVQKRTMDFIIPNKQNPKIIIECSFLVTTSSGQGDKSKTEGRIAELIKKYYPKAKFIGFVDGIGWYVRKKDLERMVNAYDEVFTFHSEELERFKNYIKKIMK